MRYKKVQEGLEVVQGVQKGHKGDQEGLWDLSALQGGSRRVQGGLRWSKGVPRVLLSKVFLQVLK